MAVRRRPVTDHKCLGCTVLFRVSCECGWTSVGHGTRAAAYAEWRDHVVAHEAPLLRAAARS